MSSQNLGPRPALAFMVNQQTESGLLLYPLLPGEPKAACVLKSGTGTGAGVEVGHPSLGSCGLVGLAEGSRTLSYPGGRVLP